jgi:hypothetical protein
MKANWIGQILNTNCLLQRVIQGKVERMIEVAGRRGRRRKQLLNDLMEIVGYCKLKEEAKDRNLWRTHCVRGYGPVVRHIKDLMKLALIANVSGIQYPE